MVLMHAPRPMVWTRGLVLVHASLHGVDHGRWRARRSRIAGWLLLLLLLARRGLLWSLSLLLLLGQGRVAPLVHHGRCK